MFAKISPDEKKAAYVSEHDLYVEDLSTHQVKQLTKDGTRKLINGTLIGCMKKSLDAGMVSDGALIAGQLLFGR